MRLVLNVEPEHMEAAAEILRTEMARVSSYDRPGWGWTHRSPKAPGVGFFVRGIKGGLSIRESRP